MTTKRCSRQLEYARNNLKTEYIVAGHHPENAATNKSNSMTQTAWL
ncbi:hypothetical protein L8C07_25880 [Paenibacillus sp. CMAA1739]|nr:MULTISPECIES: hypothetical protein [Paenibacillus]MDP1513393.1 hypothetical protein [Paenibacillus ottowii]MEC4569379.1 hypothetical protein [Paenibacillus sp. CMAA1739]